MFVIELGSAGQPFSTSHLAFTLAAKIEKLQANQHSAR
jgi:hypothetical protein